MNQPAADHLEPTPYLEALADARAERDQLHPHHPVLDRTPTTQSTRTPDVLTDELIDLGRRRLAELRAQIEANRSRRMANKPTTSPTDEGGPR